jgi:heme/copper-type cytochrome/quinol oxidase subunit 2
MITVVVVLFAAIAVAFAVAAARRRRQPSYTEPITINTTLTTITATIHAARDAAGLSPLNVDVTLTPRHPPYESSHVTPVQQGLF